jgi:hypothetical protein
MSHTRPPRVLVLPFTLCATVVVVMALGPVPQPTAYHDMADQRSCAGIPNCLNVLSNLPFAIVGALGIALVFRSSGTRQGPFRDPWERWPYLALFVGVALTAVGSSYYHLAPDNARLVWDRLPMTTAFMGFLTAVVAERVGVAIARRLLLPLLALGAASVVYWYWSELQGAGDLRPYLLVQFGSLLAVVLLMALYPARETGGEYLGAGLALYAAAKGFELADAPIYALGNVVSGHTLKHLVAAGSVACLIGMLRARTPGIRRVSSASRSFRAGARPY